MLTISVIAGQKITKPSTFSSYWLLTFLSSKHCALPKIQYPLDLSLNWYGHIGYSVTTRFLFQFYTYPQLFDQKLLLNDLSFPLLFRQLFQLCLSSFLD